MNKRILTSCAAVLGCSLLGWWWLRPEAADSLEQLRVLSLQAKQEPARVWRETAALLERFPNDRRVQQRVFEIALLAADDRQLSEFLHQHSWTSRVLLAPGASLDRLLQRGFYKTSVQTLASYAEQNPDDLQALQSLADLQLRLGQHTAARKSLSLLLARNAIPLEQLIFLCSRREVMEDLQGLQRGSQVEPSAVVWTALGAWELSQNRFSQARALFEQATAEDATFAAAWAGLGMSLYRLGEPASASAMSSWRESVLERQITEPDVLFLLGWMAEQQGEESTAVSRLAQAIAVDPLHRSASQTLGVLLSRRQQFRAAGQFFMQRAAAIDELELHMHDMLFGDRQLNDFVRSADLCAQLGEPELAVVWLAGTALFEDHPGDVPDRETVLQSAEQSRLRYEQSLQVAAAVRLPQEPGRVAAAEPKVVRETNISFVDRSAQTGLASDYCGGISSFRDGLKIYQGFGGGVAALDFDGDDFPDLFFSQACSWPPPESLPRAEQDLLYRQRQGGFDQVNALALPPEAGFGQGVSVGDFNSDGFDDLYVANIGRNRLLINNGDGTFQELASGPTAAEWTSSCLMADLNNDGLDDLFDVCYLAGDEPFVRICGGEDGGVSRERSCLPSLFAAAADRVWQNQGNGAVQDVSASSGLTAAQGRGLGIVAAEMDGQPGLELLVSNDLSANHLWQADPQAASMLFSERAEIRGLARNGEGQLEACMGIAAADFSGDLQPDFVVTNFLNETNTYYESVGGGFYRDQTEASRLGVHSRSQLGFGAQPLDADLDGDFDLVVANGHVDDYSHLGAAFQMRLDVFDNGGQGLFAHCPPSAAGSYGELKTLGRAMARVDWNRDGRDDLVITHLDRGPALLENQSRTSHFWFSIRLIGRESNRPAIGSVVTVTSNDASFVLQQQAGDGYFCSSERRLQYGGLPGAVIDEVRILWPSGRLSILQEVRANARLVVIEGRDVPYDLAIRSWR